MDRKKKKDIQRKTKEGKKEGKKKDEEINKQTPWSESASELYRLSDHRLSAKLVPIFADSGSHVVSMTDPYGRILGFLGRSRYFSFQVAPQLYSRG
jgi:CBS-domain-containing membrane protein